MNSFYSGGNDPTPTKIVLAGCDDRVCEIHRNKEVTAEFSFIAYRPSRAAHASIKVYVYGAWIPLAVNRPVCENLVSGQCPLVVGQQYIYRNSIHLPGLVPAGQRSIAIIRAVDDNDATIACVRIAVKIVK